MVRFDTDEQRAENRGSQGTGSVNVSTGITKTYWKLTEIDGRSATRGADGQELHMTLSDGDEPRVSGFSGCNRFFGSYKLEGKSLSFRPIAMTRMACAEGMEQEIAFHRALEMVVEYSINDGALMLLAASRAVVLTFDAGEIV
ncbi:MAG: META domain-containing protein [Actinomycetota bacterium]